MGKGYIVRRGGVEQPNSAVNYAMLYHAGDECVDTTGGWVAYGRNVRRQYASFRSANMMELTDYRKALFIAKATGSVPKIFAIYSTIDALSAQREPRNLGVVEATTKTIVTTDVNLDGEYYVYLGVHWSSGSSNTVTTTKNTSDLYVHLKDEFDTRGGNIYTLALFKADDWRTWMTLGGVSGFDAPEELVADHTAITTLLANEDACKFMVEHCTGEVMLSAITSSTFKTALNNSTYKEMIYANEHWSKFLAMVG